MPRSGQIIPEWLHPYEGVYINDNTRYEDVAFHTTGPVFLNVFASSKGVDNKLNYFDSVVDWVNEYGLPKEVTLNKLEYLKVEVHRTDEEGTIILKSDGNNISFTNKKTNTNFEVK